MELLSNMGMQNFSVGDNAKFIFSENCGEKSYKNTGKSAADIVIYLNSFFPLFRVCHDFFRY